LAALSAKSRPSVGSASGRSLNRAMKAAVDPVLEPPYPRAFCDEAVAGADGVTLAGRDDCTGHLAAACTARACARCGPAQVLGRRRPLPHGVNARAGQRESLDRRDVARREDAGVGQALEGGTDADPAPSRARPVFRSQGAARQPWRRPQQRRVSYRIGASQACRKAG
jgi:hypothetical protein